MDGSEGPDPTGPGAGARSHCAVLVLGLFKDETECLTESEPDQTKPGTVLGKIFYSELILINFFLESNQINSQVQNFI